MIPNLPTADELLDLASVADLGTRLEAAAPERDWSAVERGAAGFERLGLAARVRALTVALLAALPPDYPATASIVREALAVEDFRGWAIWPLSEAVATRAIASRGEGDFEDGLALLAELTGRLTAEFALRAFLAADLERTLAVALTWTTDPDEHVRRLASEGTRPRLPWGRRVASLSERPSATLPILDALHRDRSEYVRRSVANHLNDISYADSGLAVRTAAGWLQDGDPETERLARRALRSLVKRGDPDALALFGFGAPDGIEVEGPRLGADAIAVGDSIAIEAELRNASRRPAELAIDYVVNHRKANGSLSPKVFKWTTRRLAPGESTVLSRSHSFKPITTRRYHPGTHTVELQVNGVRFGLAEFELR